MDRFPLPAVSYSYSDYYQSSPSGHHGTDIFAPAGTAVLAVEDGQATADEDPTGGHVVYLTCPKTANQYYYAHLDLIDSTIPRAPAFREVRAGEMLGTVGTSGNAKGTSPHLHFQMRMRGTQVNPYSSLAAADPRKSGKQASKRAPSGLSLIHI